MTATAAQPEPAPAFDEATIREHVQMIHGIAAGQDGALVVTVFYANPTGEKDAPGVITHHRIGDVDGTVDAVMAHAETPNANVYLVPAVMRPDLPRGRKGTESDVVAVLALVADYDDDTGKTGEMPIEPNYTVESSPGNYQHFVLLDRALPPREAKELAAAFKRVSGADHCTADISHTWRIPGCLNWPNKKKLERGRGVDPVPVMVAKPWQGDLTSVDDLKGKLAGWVKPAGEALVVNVGDLPSIDGIDVSTAAAEKLAANDVGDRSAHAARVVEQLAFDGHEPETACALFLAASGNWLERYSTEDRARADFERLWAKPAAQGHVRAQRVGSELAANIVKKRQAPANDNVASEAPQPKTASVFPGIMSSGEFVRGFTPPDYLVDGIIQSGFLYSITGQTGAGKTAVALLLAACIALGAPLAGREVKPERVLYFAGENPDDVRMRWIGLCHELGLDPDDIDAHFIEGVFSIPDFGSRIEQDVDRLGGVGCIFVDTTAAYFPGTDENSNVEMGNYARLLRTFTRMGSRPAVIAASHPIKNPSADNLLPRGGGAFLNEVDGNLALAKKGDRSSELHWQGKFRGPDFKPIMFDLPEVKVPTLVDSRGREIPTVRAKTVGESEIAARAAESTREDQEMLIAIRADGSRSLRELGEALDWGGDEQAKRKAQTVTDRLKRSGFLVYELGQWKLTKKGDAAAPEAARTLHVKKVARENAERVVNGARRKRTRGSYQSQKDGTEG